MTRILHRSIATSIPTAARGEGVELFDRDGKSYIDGSGGAAVSCLGHGHPEVISALHEQLDTMVYAHTMFFTTDVAEELAERLTTDAPKYINHVYLVSGGSEATEAALKMARQYFVEKEQPARHLVISRRQSYHGNTLGALALSGNERRRQQFQPILVDSHTVDPCFAYHLQRPEETAAEYATRAASSLEQEILELGPDNVMAFVAETVVGGTAGAVPPVRDYFKHIRDICNRYGVLLILDEVMCGMGRTGTLHACEQEDIVPDLITIGKGLGGGYQPIGAVLIHEDIYEAFSSGSGSFQHGHTYIGHSMSAAAGLTVQNIVRRDGLLDNVVNMGGYLQSQLTERFSDNEHIGDIRGRGLFRAVELVADRTTKEPFPTSLQLHARIKKEAMKRGLIVYSVPGTLDGFRGDHALLAPPFIVNQPDIDRIVDRLGDAVDAALASTRESP